VDGFTACIDHPAADGKILCPMRYEPPASGGQVSPTGCSFPDYPNLLGRSNIVTGRNISWCLDTKGIFQYFW
jgi:hypothetical protein